MKTSLVVKEFPFLEFLTNLKAGPRQRILRELPRPQLECLSEILHNFLIGRVTRDPRVLQKLRADKDCIRTIARKRTALKTKRQLLSSSRGGSILGILLPLALNVVRGFLG